jgi:hypothetical protein
VPPGEAVVIVMLSGSVLSPAIPGAHKDEVSKTYWTDGEDIPGLCCQTDSFEELIEAVLALAPELLRDNGVEPPGQAVEITVIAERRATACITA